MTIEDSDQLIESFLVQCETLCNTAKTAIKNNKSLSGSNFYGNKFHEILIHLAPLKHNILKLITVADLEDYAEKDFAPYLAILESTTAPIAKRTDALKKLKLFCKSKILLRLDSLTVNPIPETEQVLPMAVVHQTRGYIEKIVLQANGCYEHQWYDACAVMIRRLIETLIIELYEARGKTADIKDRDNNFYMLSVLVDKVITDNSWNLGRETKSTLPLLKSLGDRSAHNRHYLAKKADIDKVLQGLRVVVDDLLHLSGLK